MIFLRRKFQAERFRGLSSLTCEVKIRFSRAFHIPNDQTSCSYSNILGELATWRFDLSQSWGINSDVNKFQLFENARLPESITTDSVQSFDNLSFKIFSFRRESNSRVILRNNGKYSEIFKMEVNEISKRIVAYKSID